MANKKKFLICILQHRNSSYAVTAFLHIAQAFQRQPSLRKECKIVFAATSRGDKELLKIKKYYGDEIDVDIFECNPSYPEKMKAVLATYPPEQFEYFVKHDEDLFLSPLSWVELLTRTAEALRDDKNLLTTVNLSTGIPTWHAFAQSFLPTTLKASIFDHLRNDSIPDTCWGNDYSAINTAIKHMGSSWDEQTYWDAINTLPYDYKGIHPVRTNIWYSKIINEYIAHNYQTITSRASGTTFTPVTQRYFCNSFFVMNYTTYKTIFEDKSLYSDAFDEVPINRYLKRHNLYFLTLDNSCGVHIMYNSAYAQKIKFGKKTYSGTTLEEEFSRLYFNLAKDIAAVHTPEAKNLSFVATPLHIQLKTSLKQTKFYGNLYKTASQNKHIKYLYKKLLKN